MLTNINQAFTEHNIFNKNIETTVATATPMIRRHTENSHC